MIHIFLFLEKTPCAPNPCKHNGVCKAVKNSFECDCTGTFYSGRTCEKGIVTVSKIPILSVNQTISNIKIQGYPDNSVIVTLIPSPNVLIEPGVIKLTRENTTAVVAVTGKRYGILRVKYKITGDDEAEFHTPDETLGFVDDANERVITPICYKCGGILEQGCFTEKINNIVFMSYLQWSSSKLTKGITQILAYGNNTLPLSLTGGQISLNNLPTFSVENIIKADNTTKFFKRCSNHVEEPINMGFILRTNVFEYSIQVFFNKFSPGWFKLITAMDVNEYHAKDLFSELYIGSELQAKSLACIAGFRFKGNTTYYIHQTSQIYTILLPHRFIKLPNFIRKCLVVDLNEGNIYFGFSNNDNMIAAKDKMYENIVNNVSNGISSSIGFHVISSKISFKMIGTKHILNIVGRQKYNLGLMTLNIEGRMAFSYDEALKRYNKMILAEKSIADLSIRFSMNGKAQQIQIYGFSSGSDSFKMTRSDRVAKLSTKVFPVNNIFHSGNSSMIFVLSKLSPITVNMTHNLSTISILPELMKANILSQVNKAKNVVIEALGFLQSLSLDKFLRDELENLNNFTRTLLDKLSSYQSNDNLTYSDIESTRFLFSEVLKKFSVLLDQYLQIDKMDKIGIKLKFTNFKKQHNEFIINTNVNFHDQYDGGVMSHYTLENKGKLCVVYFCFNDIALTVDFTQKFIVGKFTKQDNIGNYIKISPSSKVYYYLTKNSNSVNLKGEVVIFNEVKTVNVTVQPNFLFFNVDVRMGNTDSTRLFVVASLDAVLRDDLLYFTFTGNMNNSNQLMEDIKDNLNNYFTKLEQTIHSRKTSITSSQLTAKRSFDIANNATIHLIWRYEQLRNQLDNVDENITFTENLLKAQKKTYKLAVKQNSNITERQIQILVNQCKPKICNSSCLPGLKKEVCHKQRRVPLIDQHCFLYKVSTIIYQHVQVSKTIPITKYIKKEYCWSECPLLKTLFNKIGKRKRRAAAAVAKALISKAIKVAGPPIFKLLGGKEAELGARIGGFLGPIGTIVGGLVGSLFGSCDRYCAFDYEPVLDYIKLQEYEKRSLVKQIGKVKCENKVRYVNGSTESVSECAITTNCKNIRMDKNCIQKRVECIQVRENITNSLLDKSNLEKKFQEFAKTSFLYDLLITRRNILSQKILNVEKELVLARALNNSAYRALLSYEKSLTMFQDATRNDELMIDKYRKQPKLFRLDSLKLNFTYTSGMEFPKQFHTEINAFGLTSTSLFDVDNYQKSVRDISFELKDLARQSIHSKRKRRSTRYIKPNMMDKRCFSVQQAEMFLLEVLNTYQDKLNNFTKLKLLKENQTETNKQEVTRLKRAISSQFANVVDESTKQSLNNELDDIFTYNQRYEKETHLTNSWNSTLVETFSDLQLLVDDMQKTDCLNLLDCLEFYTSILKDLIEFEVGNESLTTIEKLQHLKTKMFRLITGYPDIKHSEKLITQCMNLLAEINPNEFFCGNAPTLKISLQGIMRIQEGENLRLKVKVLNIKNGYKIIWKHNNFFIPGYNTTFLKKTISKVDEGHYSCEISNKFGVSHCGTIFVEVFEKIELSIEPQNVTGYIYSLKKLYLTCYMKNKTLNGTYLWFFRRFSDPESKKKLLVASTPRLEIDQSTFLSSGFYSCQFNSKLTSGTSQEAKVHVLNSTVVVERIRVTMMLSSLNISRNRREVPDGIKVIKSEIAKLMQIRSSQIELSNLTKEDREKNRMKFVLSGRNFNTDNKTYRWDDLPEKIIKERKNLLLRPVLLYLHINNSKNLTFNENKYSIDGDSILVESLEPSCPQGQSLLKNGFICGKFQATLLFIIHFSLICHHRKSNLKINMSMLYSEVR